MNTLTVDDLTENEFLAVYKARQDSGNMYRWLTSGNYRRELIHKLMGHTIIEADGGPVGMYTIGCSCGVKFKGF